MLIAISWLHSNVITVSEHWKNHISKSQRLKMESALIRSVRNFNYLQSPLGVDGLSSKLILVCVGFLLLSSIFFSFSSLFSEWFHCLGLQEGSKWDPYIAYYFVNFSMITSLLWHIGLSLFIGSKFSLPPKYHNIPTLLEVVQL